MEVPLGAGGFVAGGIEGGLKPGMDVPLTIHYRDGKSQTVTLTCRIDTAEEIEYFKNGGVLHYVLRNLGVRHLILVGVLTDQCVDSSIRDACDLGYLVTVATDACVTQSAERQETSLRNNRGYCRQVTTAALVAEIERLTAGQGA